jgi:membrane fusion protein (multidrug efflux system)
VVNGNKVSQKRITLGNQVNDQVIVQEGLQIGDEIVTQGTQKLRDNSVIALNSAGNKTGPGSSRGY